MEFTDEQIEEAMLKIFPPIIFKNANSTRLANSMRLRMVKAFLAELMKEELQKEEPQAQTHYEHKMESKMQTDGKTLAQIAYEASGTISKHLECNHYLNEWANVAEAVLNTIISRIEAVTIAELQEVYWHYANMTVRFEAIKNHILAAARDGQAEVVTPRQDWKFAFDKLDEDFKAATTRAEKAEAELARVREMYDAKVIEESESVKPQLSQLRPISESGPVPEGCERVFTSQLDSWRPKAYQIAADTHFADIQLPAVKAEDSAESDLCAELKAAHAAGKVIQIIDGGLWHDLSNPTWSDSVDQYRIKPDHETFEAHGKTWTRHTPGDPMPCYGDAILKLLFKDNNESNLSYEAKELRWTNQDSIGDIIGWRYADELTPESLEPEPWTPKVGDVVTLKSGGPKMTVMDIEENGEIWCSWFNDYDGVLGQDFPTACLQPA